MFILSPGASADEANAKLVHAKLAYDGLAAAQTDQDRLTILSEVEQDLTSIVKDDSGSDLAVKIVSGEKVAGLDYDAIRVEKARLQAVVDTRNSIYFIDADNEARRLCWNDGKVFCLFAQASFHGVALYQTFAAGDLGVHSATWSDRVVIHGDVAWDQHDIEDYVLRSKPISAPARSVSHESSGGDRLMDTILSVTPVKATSDATVSINGVAYGYLERTRSFTVPKDRPDEFVPSKVGGKAKSTTSTEYIIPKLTLGSFTAADLQAIKAGRLVAGKANALDALLAAWAFTEGDLPRAEADARMACVIPRLGSLPAPPAEVLQTVAPLAEADDPFAAFGKWTDDLDKNGAGDQFLAVVTPRWKPIVEACHLPLPQK